MTPMVCTSRLLTWRIFPTGDDPGGAPVPGARGPGGDATGLSPSGTSYALRDLEERGVVETRKVGREKRVRLPSRAALIEEWSREYHWRDNAALRVMAPVGAPGRFLKRMGVALGNHRSRPSRPVRHSWCGMHLWIRSMYMSMSARAPASCP